MRYSVITVLAGILALGLFLPASAQEQEYKATPVTISKDKVKVGDKQYYSHVVLERQTLFSISRAYGVTVQDIYDANPALDLEKSGLKTYQILMIPITEEASAPQVAAAATSPEPATKTDGYVVHIVKWYEDLGTIARRYGVSKEAIMKANSMTSQTLGKKQKLLIPVGEGYTEADDVTIADDKPIKVEDADRDKGVFGTITDAITEKAEEIFYIGKKDISAALILPFNAQKQPNDNNLDFYSGVLMAMRDLKNDGINVDLSVYDAVGGNIPVTVERFDQCDLVIGPISAADLTTTLGICPESTTVVSPLEPKAAALAEEHPNLIQAPSSTDAQCADLIKWLAHECKSGDKVILITEKGATLTSAASSLVTNLQASGLEYATITYGVLEGKNMTSRIEAQASADHTTRIVLASESEAFVGDVIRNANLIAHRKHDVAVYCLSKVRSFETIEVENFHNTNLHTSTGYYIDYDSPKVQNFLLAYRALFNTEPGPFAFQGYDTAYSFIKMCSKYGKRWPDKLENSVLKGLQSNFQFEQTRGGGRTNKAVRRVVYGPDFSIKLVN